MNARHDLDTYGGAGLVRLRLLRIKGLKAQVRSVIQVTMTGDRYALDAAHHELQRVRDDRPEITLQVDEEETGR